MTSPTVEKSRSFVRLVCPFLVEPDFVPARMTAADEAGWTMNGSKNPVWTRLDAKSVLPNAERYLSAPWDATPVRDDELSTHVALWKLDNRFVTSVHGLGGGRLSKIHLGKRHAWVKLGAVELALFGTGVGFVVFEFSVTGPPRGLPPDDSAPAHEPGTWIDLVKYVRRIPQPVLGRMSSAGEQLRSVRDDVWTLLGTLGLSGDAHIDGAGASALLSATPITFTSLFIKGGTEQQAREWVVQLRYSLGSNPGVPASPDQLALQDGGIQRRSDRSWFFGSGLSTGFVGLDLPVQGYWQHFPGELRRQYQLALLLVLQQRHALLRVGELVSSYWLHPDDSHRVTRFSDLQRRLHYLAAHLMPLQYSHRSSQQRFYRTMRHAFGVLALHDDARRTVTELSESLRLDLTEKQNEQQSRFERVVSAFALFFGVPSLVLAFLAIDVSGIAKPLPLLAAVSALLASFALGATIGLLARRRRR